MSGLDRLARGLGAWCSWLFIGTVGITVYEVAARYLFGSPTIWAHELTIILCSLAFAVGGAYVQQADEHIRVTILTESMPLRIRSALQLLGSAAGAIFLAGVIVGGYRDAWEALSGWQTTQTAFNSPMPAIVKPAVLAMALLMILLLLRDIGRRLLGTGDVDGAGSGPTR